MAKGDAVKEYQDQIEALEALIDHKEIHSDDFPAQEISEGYDKQIKRLQKYSKKKLIEEGKELEKLILLWAFHYGKQCDRKFSGSRNDREHPRDEMNDRARDLYRVSSELKKR